MYLLFQSKIHLMYVQRSGYIDFMGEGAPPETSPEVTGKIQYGYVTKIMLCEKRRKQWEDGLRIPGGFEYNTRRKNRIFPPKFVIVWLE